MTSLSDSKEKAIIYYKENGVPQKMQDVLNAMFSEQPKDVWGYLSTFFGQFSPPPSIVALKPRRCKDSKGMPALALEVLCEAKNETANASCEQVSVDTALPDNAKYDDKEAEDKRRADHVEAALETIGADLSALLKGCDPANQDSIDSCLAAFFDRLQQRADEAARAAQDSAAAAAAGAAAAAADDKKGAKKSAGGGGKGSAKKKAAQAVVIADAPKEPLVAGSLAASLVSVAVCSAAASLRRVPLFQHVAELCGGAEVADAELEMPVPMIALLQSGKASSGKSKCIKEYMVVPKPSMAAAEALQHAARMFDIIQKAMYAKGGVAAKSVSDFGSLLPALDRPEQGLDMIQDAASQLGLRMGEDFYLAINAAASEIFDYEKGKYEVVTGVLKSTEDMPDFWTDMINRYPAIVAIFDPVRKEETATWARLCELVSGKCYVLSDRGCRRPGIMRNQDLANDFPCSGVTMRLEMRNTVTDLASCARQLRAARRVVVMAAGQHETSSSALVDLAVGAGANFVKLGGLSRGERAVKYSRLAHISELLTDERRLRVAGERFAFQPMDISRSIADGEATEEPGVGHDDGLDAAAK